MLQPSRQLIPAASTLFAPVASPVTTTPLERARFTLQQQLEESTQTHDVRAGEFIQEDVGYVTAVNAPLYQQPVRELDTVIAEIPYGARVALGERQGTWRQVMYRNRAGWVSDEVVKTRAGECQPFFVNGEYCAADSGVTERTRLIINDVLYGGESGVPLSGEEYVYYRLLTHGVVPPAIEARPRRAGTWQHLFKGERGVHVTVRPKTRSVMEYIDQEAVGHVAYVQAVFPDETIHIAEVGYPQSGFYQERTLDQETWQALKPVFLQFT